MPEFSPFVPSGVSDESQLNRNTVESYGGEASFLILEAESTETGIPVIVAGGWSEGTGSLLSVGKQITANKRRAILIDHARSGGPSAELDISETEHRANTILAVLEKAGIAKADVIAHSEGALDITLAALKCPEKFRNIVLMAPAGMIGDDSILALASRFAPKLIRGATKDMIDNPKVAIRINTDGSKYIAKNPIKAAREVSDMANIRIDSMLSGLRASGIHVGLIQAHSDPVFPDERIFDNTKVAQDGNVDAYASSVTENAGHDDVLIHPIRAEGAIQMLEHFERLEEKNR